MFVIKINGIESSAHSNEIDANRQKEIFVSAGIDGANIVIVEQENFDPPKD